LTPRRKNRAINVSRFIDEGNRRNSKEGTATVNQTAAESKWQISLAEWGRDSIARRNARPDVDPQKVRRAKPLVMRITGSLHMTIQTAV
jgi:hypothetical protein